MNHSLNLKYAIFDMDGLMFDTERLVITAFQRCISPQAGCEFPTDKMTQFLGLDFRACTVLFAKLFNSRLTFKECRDIASVWIQNYIDTNGIPIKPGLITLLEWLKKCDFHTAVATSSNYDLAYSYITTAKINHYFEKIISGDMITKSKPDPQIFEAALSALQCNNKLSCIIFEDSLNGLLAAEAAKIPCIIVPDLIDPTLDHDGMYLAKVNTLADAIPVINAYNI